MTENYIDDGQIHILNKNYAYILKIIPASLFKGLTDFSEILDIFVRKYAEYIYEKDRKKAIQNYYEEF